MLFSVPSSLNSVVYQYSVVKNCKALRDIDQLFHVIPHEAVDIIDNHGSAASF